MAKPFAESPPAAFGIRLVLMVLLPLIALAIYLDGQRYDPDLVKLTPRSPDSLPTSALFPETLEGLPRLGQPRHFDKDNLYEYINGHAEYFIGAGFRGLAVGEYGDAGGDQPTLVVSLYDMGAPLNAFGVLVDEAGEQEAVDNIGTMGFGSGQGLSFIHGPYYVQMSLFNASLSAHAAGTELALRLAEQERDPGLAFRFPDLGKITSTRFIKDSYHGLEFLNGVLERSFERETGELKAFLIQGSAAETRDLVGAFESFFRDDEMPYQRIDREGLAFFRVEDPYESEWFFVPLDSGLIGAFTPLDEELMVAIEKFAENNQ